MNDISKLTKQEMINYLYVRDIVRDSYYDGYTIDYIDIMSYTLPFVLIIIAVLISYLVYQQNAQKDHDDVFLE